MSKQICHKCNHEFELYTGDIFYGGKFFHKKCDPLPNADAMGMHSKCSS